MFRGDSEEKILTNIPEGGNTVEERGRRRMAGRIPTKRKTKV